MSRDLQGRPPRRLEALDQIGRELLAELDRGRLLRLITDRASELFASAGAIYLLRDGRLEPVTWSALEPVALAAGEGIVGRCVVERRGAIVNDYLPWPGAVAHAVAHGVTVIMAQPLLAGDEVFGAIAMNRAGPSAPRFEADDLHALGLFASGAGLALRNATLYEQSERRRREAEEIARLARLHIAGPPDVNAVARSISEGLLALLPARSAVVWTLGVDDMLRPIAMSGLVASAVPDVAMAPGDGVTGRAVAENRPMWSPDPLGDPGFDYSAESRRLYEVAGGGALLAVPLRDGGRAVGAVMVGRERGAQWDEAEIALVQSFADQAAIALEHARLYEDSERGRREAEALAEIARTINATLDVETILQRVVEDARTVCDADLARIALRDPDSEAMRFRYWINARYDAYERLVIHSGDGVGGKVMATGTPFRSDNWSEDARISKETRHVVEAEAIVAMLTVPIRIDGRVEGLLYVDNRRPCPFTARDERTLVRLAEHAAAAIRNARLFAAAQTAGSRLQALSARLLEVQEAERRHIARELHDEIGQALTAVKINLRALRGEVASGPRPRLTESLEIVDGLLQTVRKLSLDLRPSMLDDLGLAAALRWYVNTHASRAGLEAEVVSDLDDASSLPGNLAITCFRVAQEAVTNVLRHAKARHLAVELRRDASEIELTIRDDGVGFDVAGMRRPARAGRSLGLLGMQERVELVGGRLSIASTASRGTVVQARFPWLEAVS